MQHDWRRGVHLAARPLSRRPGTRWLNNSALPGQHFASYPEGIQHYAIVRNVIENRSAGTPAMLCSQVWRTSPSMA